MAVVGSTLGLATALLMQAPPDAIHAGLWGYNAVLGCQAVGGLFFYPNRTAFALAGLCAVMCTFFGGAMATIFKPFGLPTCPRRPPGRLSAIRVSYVDRLCVGLFYGRAGRLTAENDGFRPGQ
jgi:hypothetical protein